jgi:hypothetical protein
MLSNNKCRNRDCVLGNTTQATVPQLEKICQLCEELGIDISNRDQNKLTKEKASNLISRLIKQKVDGALFKEEVSDEDSY